MCAKYAHLCTIEKSGALRAVFLWVMLVGNAGMTDRRTVLDCRNHILPGMAGNSTAADLMVGGCFHLFDKLQLVKQTT